MTMFLTKAWGFSSPSGPLQFGLGGKRESARQVLKPGDLVAVAGTKQEPTAPQDYGRLLGIMEPTTEPVASLDFDIETFPHDFVNGEYKWPYALIIRRAWMFVDGPRLNQVSSRRFNMDAASGIVPLNAEEEARILQLPRTEVPVLTSLKIQARLEGAEVARLRNAPPPSTMRSGIMHLRRAPAYTYAMQIDGASELAFKIGWAFNYTARARDFNLYAMPSLGGLSYRVIYFELWETARKAFQMEQHLLKSFDNKRHPTNREILTGISRAQVDFAWSDSVLQLRRSSR
jgi:hypothetical protein